MEKIAIKYTPYVLTDTQGNARVCARITERTTYNIDQLVEYALSSGYVRGQAADLKGTFNGFLSALKAVLELGAAVNCDWFRVETVIKGELDENRRVTSANSLKTVFKALTDLKLDISNFAFTNVENPEKVVKVSNIMAVNGEKGYVEVGKATGVYGANLYYNAAYGDKVTVSWPGQAAPLEIVPTEADWAHMEFANIAALAAVPEGTPITFTFYLHGGVEGSQTQIISKLVSLINPSTFITGVEDEDGNEQITKTKGFTIYGAHLPTTFTDAMTITEKDAEGTAHGSATLPSLVEDGAIVSHDENQITINNLVWTPLAGTAGSKVYFVINGATYETTIVAAG